jgi:hypothetical protein
VSLSVSVRWILHGKRKRATFPTGRNDRFDNDIAFDMGKRRCLAGLKVLRARVIRRMAGFARLQG